MVFTRYVNNSWFTSFTSQTTRFRGVPFLFLYLSKIQHVGIGGLQTNMNNISLLQGKS